MVHTKSNSDCLMDCNPAILAKESFLEGIHKHCCNILASDLVRDNKTCSTEFVSSDLKGIPDASNVAVRACSVGCCSNKDVSLCSGCVSLGSRLAIICFT